MTKKKWSSRFKDVPLDFRGAGCFWKIKKKKKKKKLDSLWKRKELLHLRRRKRKRKTKTTKTKTKTKTNKNKTKTTKINQIQATNPSGWKSYIPNCCIIVMVNNVPGHLGHRIILLSTTVIVILYFNLNIFQNFRMF